MDEGWIQRGGVRLHYVEWRPDNAREPALFLLHGLSSNARVWERAARLLPDRRIVALDQRSHGPSDRPPAGYALPELVADAAHAIRELGLGRPLVAGHSWGAVVALDLASTKPDLASGLVLVDGAVRSFSRFMTWEEVARLMQPPLPTYRDLAEAAGVASQSLGDAWGDDLEDFVRAGLVEAQPAGFTSTLTAGVRLEILRELFDFQPELLLATVEGPVLLAIAERLWPGAPQEFADRRRRSADEVVELRPDARVRWYDSLHDIPLIRPAELAADLERTAIAAAFWSLAREAAALTARPGLDWTAPAQGDGGEDGDGWEARELLAHLSSTQAALAAVVATPPPPDGAGQPAFDPNRWNASQVRRRQERSPADLAEEMRAGAERVQAALMAADLDAETRAGSFAGVPLREAMEGMLAHQRGHLAELREALSPPAVPR